MRAMRILPKRHLKLIIASLAVLLLLALCRCGTVRHEGCPGHKGVSIKMMKHPAVALLAEYEDINAGCQTIVPYFLSIMGVHSLLNNKHEKQVLGFIRWNLDHLNELDRWGVRGSIYDYTICFDGSELSTKQYDSADGYAGQFLILLNTYFQKTGNKIVLQKYKGEIFKVARVIIQLQDDDGLDIAMPSYPVKYLMDNCEAFGGLEAFCSLAESLEWGNIEKFSAAKQKMKEGILTHLFDKEKMIFFWAKDEGGYHGSDWDNYYPDALAQLFPILYNVIEPDSVLAKNIWERFNRIHGSAKIEGIEQRLLINMLKEKLQQT